MLRTCLTNMQTSIRRLSRTSIFFANIKNTATTGCCFELNDVQKKLQNCAREFAREEVLPVAADYDRIGEFPWPVFEKAWKCGLLNGLIPAYCGGKEGSLTNECVIDEELSFGCGGIAKALVDPYFGQVPVIQVGTRQQQIKYLGRLIEEPLISAYCVPEAGAELDINKITARAVRKGDEWILNGQKMWVTGGGVVNWFLVLARTDSDLKAPTTKSFTCFIVEREWPGVVIDQKELNMGLRAADNRRITFEDVRIPKANILVGEGAGFQSVTNSFNITKVLVGVLATGVARRCLHEATEYVIKHRSENNEDVDSILADMAIDVEIARFSCLKSAWEVDTGKPYNYSASVAKCFAGDIANKCATHAVQICGSDGFNSEHPVEKLFRDAQIYQLYEGTSHAQRLIISREVIAKARLLV